MTIARIGRFQVERPLGSGSFATVWQARDEDLDAWVAIKLLAENWSLNEDARRRFVEEARALRRLDNDRIVRVYEVGRLEDDRPYMVMEFADRGTLEDRMRVRSQLGQPFSVEEAVELSRAIAACLVSVHDLRMVHRDVKPSNVLFRSVPRERQEALRREGRPVTSERVLLGDFGIARRLEGVLGHTMVLGSPQYMAPEQSDPERARLVDYRGDIYSAAVILYELLTGRLPHPYGSLTELQRSGTGARPPALEGLRPEVPRALAEIVERGLARDPDERFPSAWEWREALDSVEAGSRLPSTRPVPAVAAYRSPALARPADQRTTAPEPATGARRTAVATSPAATTGASSTATAVGSSTEAATASPAVTTPVPPAPGSAVSEGPVPPAPGGSGGGTTSFGSRALAVPVGLHFPAAMAALAGLAMVVGMLLPWSSGAQASAFDSVGVVGILTALLLIGAWVMWVTRRRWLAITASAFVLLAGLAGATLAAFVALAVLIDGEAELQAGLAAVFLAGLLGAAAGRRAMRRLRTDPRRWV